MKSKSPTAAFHHLPTVRIGCDGGERMGRMRERTRAALRTAGLPEDVALGTARLTMLGDGVARVENHRGLVELSPVRVRLRTQEGIMCVEGESLHLRLLTRETAEIEGVIKEISP